MKKILVSLVLIFGLFFSFGNVNVNAQITEKEKQKISQFVNNYFNKLKNKYGKEKAISKLREINRKVIYLEETKTGRIRELLDAIQKEIANTLISVTLGNLIEDLEKRGTDSVYNFGDKEIIVNKKGILGANETFTIKYNNKNIFEKKVQNGEGKNPRIILKGVYNNKLFFVFFDHYHSMPEILNQEVYFYDFSKDKLVKTNFSNIYVEEGKSGTYVLSKKWKENRKLYLIDLNNNIKKLYEDNIGSSENLQPSFGIEKLDRFELLSNGRIKLFLESKNSKGKWYTFSKIINNTGKIIEDKIKGILDTKYHLQDTIVFGDRTIKIYKRNTGRKYITDYRDNPYKSRYLLMKNDNDYPEIPRSKFRSNIRNEVAVKITSSIYGNQEETIFEKIGPDLGFCPHDSCINSINIKGIYNNKLFFESEVNIINGKYIMYKKYIYDFAKKKLIERDFGYGKISSGKKGIYYMRNNGTLGNYKNTKLILLDNNYNEKVIFEDTSGNYRDGIGLPFGSEELYNFELLSNGRIKLFLRATNSKGKEYVFSKIIEVK